MTPHEHRIYEWRRGGWRCAECDASAMPGTVDLLVEAGRYRIVMFRLPAIRPIRAADPP